MDQEKIKYKKEDLLWILRHFYPSSRKIINILQEYTFDGELKINKEDIDSDSINEKIIGNILNKDFSSLREYMSKLPDPSGIFLTLYDSIDNSPRSLQPNIIICIAKYQAFDATVRDRLINSVACTVEIMEML